jgi:hypothetical protein
MRKALALVAAGTAIAGGLLSVAGTADAAVAAPHKTPTALLVHVAKPVIKKGTKDTVSGILWWGAHKPVAGQVVWLEAVDGKKLVPVGHQTTNKAGAVAFTGDVQSTTVFELVFAGSKNLDPSRSGTVTIKVVK